MGVALLMKKSTLNSFERIAKEMDDIRRAKKGKNKYIMINFLKIWK